MSYIVLKPYCFFCNTQLFFLSFYLL